jgi:hypothetical protein
MGTISFLAGVGVGWFFGSGKYREINTSSDPIVITTPTTEGRSFVYIFGMKLLSFPNQTKR